MTERFLTAAGPELLEQVVALLAAARAPRVGEGLEGVVDRGLAAQPERPFTGEEPEARVA